MRFCVDHIVALSQVLEKYRDKSKQIGLVFINLKKAYDSVLRKLLWEALYRDRIAKFSFYFIKIVQEMIETTYLSLKLVLYYDIH